MTRGIILAAICTGLILLASGLSDANNSYLNNNAIPQNLSQIWKERIDPIVKDQPRLRIFASAVWENHRTQKPSHQHLLQSSEQKCDAPFPDLKPVQPLHETSQFDWCKSLECNWKIVLEELEAKNSKSSSTRSSDWKTSTTALCQDTTGFTKLTLQGYQGNPTDIGTAHFPKTLDLLTSTVNNALAPRPVNINCQAPKTGLTPHSDNMNFILTCHLGLILPRKKNMNSNGDECCIFHIGRLEYYWKQGRVVIADTSFLHATENTSSEESRYVLAFNIWHPDLSDVERDGIRAIHAALQHVQEEEATIPRSRMNE